MSGATAALAGSADEGGWPPGARPMPSPGRAIVTALLLAVAAFVASTLIVVSRLRDVSVQAHTISTNSMPSVIALTTLRERLDELVSSLNQASDARASRLPDLERTATEIGAQTATYEAHAVLPQRQGEWLRTRSLVTSTLSSARRVRDDLAAGRDAEGRATLDGQLRASAVEADRQLLRLVQESAIAGEECAQHIDRVRRSATALLLGLDVACVGLAVALTALALRAVGRHTRLLQSRSQELEQFAARVAHDVRGPLSPVTLVLQRLRKEAGTKDPRRAMLDTALRSLGRVTELVDDLLGFAMAAGPRDRSARANALVCVRATLEEAEGLAKARAIEIAVDAEAEDVILACPTGVLTSLVSNLVHNAIKYMGEARERRIAVRTLRIGSLARVEVKDTGPGLQAGTEGEVFAPYVRADRSGQEGLGLGLATVKRLAEGYGGRVGVRSSSSGCVFWFEVPIAVGE